MARRRDPGAVSFDVSHDVAAGTDPRAAPGSQQRPEGRRRTGPRAWWRGADRRQRRTAVGLVTGSVAVLVGGLVVGGVLADRVEADRLLAAPGGVPDLAGDLAEEWQVEIDGVAAVLPSGGLATVEDGELVAYDVATGGERWRVVLGADPVCGPAPRATSGVEWTLPVELVTCLHGPAGTRTVSVLDAAGGVVGERELPGGEYGGEHRAVVPAAEGGLVVAEYDPGLPTRLEYRTLDSMFARLPDLEVDTGAATVHLEDALTGEHRLEVPMQEMAWLERNAMECYVTRASTTGPDGTRSAIVADLELPTPVATVAMIEYHGCGVDGSTTYDGTVLGAFTDELETGRLRGGFERQPYPDGGFVVPTPSGSALVDDDGTATTETAVLLAAPTATDGQVSDVLLGVDGDEVVALRADGIELWRASGEQPRVVARTAGTVVVAAWDGLAAFDLGSGTELWRVASPVGVQWFVTSAVTDGSRVAMAVQAFGAVAMSTDLVSIDLTSGAATTTSLDGSGVGAVVAVAGNPLLIESEPAPDSGALVASSVAGLGSSTDTGSVSTGMTG